MTARVVVAAALAGLVACGHSAGDARFPKRPDGCEVTLFHEAPDVPVENIGPVHAGCADDVAPDDCVRTLKDVVCGMGGDVVWGVGEPKRADGKIHFYGRAAHTKTLRAQPARVAPPLVKQ